MFSDSVAFLEKLEELKLVERNNMVLGGLRRENSAEHSWHSAMMAWVLKPYITLDVDYDKVIRMLLIHDIVEIDVGDVSIYEEEKRKKVALEEKEAAKHLFTMLAEPIGEEMLHLWNEFEECKTLEAKVAKAIDGFQPVINYLFVGKRYQDIRVTVNQVLPKKKILKEVSPFLWEKLVDMVIESSQRGLYLLEED